MAMLNRIIIHNLKSIDRLEINLSNLNLFVGANSSGKSTILQGLLFSAQNAEDAVGLNGKFVKLGDLEENCCAYITEKAITVEVFSEENHLYQKVYKDTDTNKLSLQTRQNSGKEQWWKNVFSIKNRNIQYLSCHRIGPMRLYDKNMSMDDTIDSNGRYAISYLNTHGSDPINENICQGYLDFTLLGQVNWWLNYIVGTEIMTDRKSVV